MVTKITLPCNISYDQLILWYDDNHLFSKERTFEDGFFSETNGNRHDLEDAKRLRDWLNEVIAEEENSNG